MSKAIQRHLIDAATASKIMQAGYADADLCNQTLLQCGQEAAERGNRNVDADQNERLQNACTSRVDSVCDRTYKNCQ
jgi:hypothetical protein